MRKMVLFIALLGFSSGLLAQAKSIAGVWKHNSKPAIIQFDMEADEAFILQHDEANSAGLNLIKNIVQLQGDQYRWYAKMFDGYQNKYVDVTIYAKDEQTLLISTANKDVVLTLVR